MIWKLLGLQKKLDALFDDGWGNLGLLTERSSPSATLGMVGVLTQPQD